MDIGKIDENLRVSREFHKPDAVYRDCREEPFSVHGLQWEDGFYRVPHEVAKETSEGVEILAKHTAGGRIRFRTDSSYVVLSCQMPSITRFPHMPLFGTTGFDLYADGLFFGTFCMPVELKSGYDAVLELGESKLRDIEIGFPLYNMVTSVKIGLEESAQLLPPKQYAVEKPVVYYGSSITQGGCVSRPGLSYPSLISTALNIDYINLGFSGSAKGETAMAEFIAGLDQSLFVMDYDHNAPSVEHLEQTHEPFFRIVREKNPHLPVLFVSMPDIRYNPIAPGKREVIRKTYENAKKAGDNKVWFIDGETLWGEEHWDACTMDKCHPNDLGHFRMAQVIGTMVKEILFDK
ncbi:MAG: hypothetical protein E7399_05145 [Ruminococcaceae bacterium]|nr:hypothetical protein [Oscillospiraceae bacterium]